MMFLGLLWKQGAEFRTADSSCPKAPLRPATLPRSGLLVRVSCGGEVWRGGLDGVYPLPTLSSVGASLAPPCSGFHTPLIEPDVRMCRIRLPEKTHAIAKATACDAVRNYRDQPAESSWPGIVGRLLRYTSRQIPFLGQPHRSFGRVRRKLGAGLSGPTTAQPIPDT
jgi:hypothetical protein